jgi:hypothetical protein
MDCISPSMTRWVEVRRYGHTQSARVHTTFTGSWSRTLLPMSRTRKATQSVVLWRLQSMHHEAIRRRT